MQFLQSQKRKIRLLENIGWSTLRRNLARNWWWRPKYCWTFLSCTCLCQFFGRYSISKDLDGLFKYKNHSAYIFSKIFNSIILKATRMDGDIGFMTIKPDQMQVVNPFLILVFIPLYEMVFYPLLKYVGIRRPLQKLTIGGILAGLFLRILYVY